MCINSSIFRHVNTYSMGVGVRCRCMHTPTPNTNTHRIGLNMPYHFTYKNIFKVMHFIFLILFSYMLMCNYHYTVTITSDNILEIILIVWRISYAISEIEYFIRKFGKLERLSYSFEEITQSYQKNSQRDATKNINYWFKQIRLKSFLINLLKVS